MEKLSDSWQTPQWLFDKLNEEFIFRVDLCATWGNTKTYRYYEDYINNVQAERNTIGPTQYREIKPYEVLNQYQYECSAFMNPPYSNPKPFIEKAWEDSKYCKIVCLVKCDPSTKWWSTFWDYGVKCHWCGGEAGPCPYYYDLVLACNKCCDTGTYNGPKPGCEARFFPKRIKFDPPDGYTGKVSSPSFASALLIFDRRSLK